jgi:hypothetical protein
MGKTTTPRTRADLGTLSRAEEQVLAEIDSGEFVMLGDGTRPEGSDPSRQVRAALIRMLLVPQEGDGLPRLHEKGLRIKGAWIPDVLDLEGCRVHCDLALIRCRFDEAPLLRSSALELLSLGESCLPGLDGDRLKAAHGVFLRRLMATGPLRLREAKLGGTLDCQDATLAAGKGVNGRKGVALSADGIEAKGGITFQGVTSRGEVRLLGANLGGDLDCVGATFEGPEYGGPDGDVPPVLSLGGARIGGVLFLRAGAHVAGALDLTGGAIGAICDDRSAWPPPGGLLLNRCSYEAFSGRAAVDAAARIEWLGRMEPVRWGDDFWPQPYEQCAKVLREMGHGEDARAVLIAKERLQRAARRARAEPAWRRVLEAWDALLDHTIRFGQQPLRAFLWLGVFWAVGLWVFGLAATQDALKPSSPVVLRSAEWVLCAVGTDAMVRFGPEGTELAGRAAPGQSQRDCFRTQPEAASYPGFLALTYSLDTILPIASLQQQEFWIPDETKPYGAFARTYLWVHIAVGWALSLLAVAGFSGLVKSD